ncbi:MAG: transporter substrate-binding domain-containing protein [Geobacteraceae bacterium]|nr:transporter substrate-binding domain-containing protein [Geobacteraceae bacterium]NTW80618.1 transporter substrate-binding domain-containing protein [Geobacteraceae bacterium]
MKRILLLLVITIMLATASLVCADTPTPQKIRIAAFNFYPTLFQTKNGSVQGFYVDFLSEIAKREGWAIEYVYGNWAEGLSRIKSGEVDVLTNVALTTERKEFMDYGKVPLLTVWAELYAPNGSPIDNIRDVQNKKIALMKGDFNAANFKDLMEKFGIPCTYVEYGNFEEVFKAISARQVDAGVVNNTFGTAKQSEYDLKSTGVIFNPFDIFFTVAKGKNSAVLATLDRYLEEWRKNERSPYHQARERWSHKSASTIRVVHPWLKKAAVISGVLLCIAVGFVVLLRIQVRRKTMVIQKYTDELHLATRQLEEELAERQVAQEALLKLKAKLQEQNEELQVDEEKLRTQNDHLLATEEILRLQINEFETAQKLLLESEIQYRNLADAGLALIWRSGTDKLCYYFNKTWLDFTGRTLEQETGNGWTEGVYPEDFDQCLKTYVSAFDKREKFEMEYRLRHVSGEYRWILDMGTPNYNVKNEFVGYIGHCIDITERKRIEEVQSYLLQINLLNTGEDFFESLARYLATILGMDYVCIDTLHGDCLTARTLAIYCDGKFEDNVEYTLKDTPCGDVAGKEICVFPREVRNLFPQDEALQDLQAESYVGTTLWSYDMKPIGLIAVIGRKELNSSHFAESVLKLVSIRAAGELERRQAEEEKLLVEQQFQQTQKLESLGVLAGGIAHDFNNILAIIMGYCSLTKMDYENADKHIPEIEKAAERAAALSRQMLAYAGKASLSQAQVNTWMLVDEMVTMLKTTIQKNVVIKAELGTDIPFIMGDASQIRQVVMNLVINAAEAIGDAEGAIDVRLVKAELKAKHTEKDHLGLIIPPGRYILFEVTDNGCGMDEETSRKIFEPFYTTKFTGRGLGMSAVLGIIKAHNGAMQLESHPGQGTTFKVYLPVQFSKSESEEAQQKAASAPWHGSGTILLAEDEEQVKSIAIILLQELGFTVLDAENGKEALELYQQNTADINLVITDMGMPVMNGYELFYKLKQLDPHLPIIISSGFGEGDIDSKIPREEIAGLINKPYNFDQLREVLRGVVEGAK